MADGLVIAAPCSGSGKTVVTLALLRALARRGAVASAKTGPDYIDPHYHGAASGSPCYNLDLWAMRERTIARLLGRLSAQADMVLVEGVMGLFDGPEAGKGSTADLASHMKLPVVLAVDCSHQSQSIAALVHGFSTYRDDIEIAGIILNRTSSDRHVSLLSEALKRSGVPVVGHVPRDSGLSLPSRHLGLVQAGEHPEIEGFLDRAADLAEANVDLDLLRSLARPISLEQSAGCALPPLGQRIAVARDEAFGFSYPHLLDGWQEQGAEILTFSPLNDEAPDASADALFLPGGYPELHAGIIASAETFLNGVRAAASGETLIYGECGGYMVLGDALIDADGRRHVMAGLLPVTTNFARRKLNLGYRRLSHHSALPFPTDLSGHEFHYSTIAEHGAADPLFIAGDSGGRQLPPMGQRRGRIMGSYAHVIDAA